jgi:hypothetical protein
MYIHEQLMKARHDGWLRAAARSRLAAETRRARTERTSHAVAQPSHVPAAPARHAPAPAAALLLTRHRPENPKYRPDHYLTSIPQQSGLELGGVRRHQAGSTCTSSWPGRLERPAAPAAPACGG